jgi:ketosteroid isomerase-like protein
MEVTHAMDFDQFVEQYHLTMAEFAKGNPKPVIALLSHGNDTSLAGGFGGFTHGYDQVAKNIEFAATQFKEGKISFESLAKIVTQDMGYIVEIERYKAKLGGSEDVALDVLRVTSIFRLEKGVWKLVHRHGDPTTAMNALVQLLPKAVVSIQKAV